MATGGFSPNTAKDFSMRRVKTRIVQPGKSGAPGSEPFTDSAALSDDCHESSSAAQMLPIYLLFIVEYRIRRHCGDNSYAR